MSRLAVFSGVFAFVLFGMSVTAQEKKEKAKAIELKGEVCCTKCCLKETEECGNAIKVKKDDKEVVFYFKDKGKAESYHKKICGKPAEGTVKGVVVEKEGKKWITLGKGGVKYTE
ncbi:MAG: hypothetical protein EXR99_04365 [Gemmataceae bacterium]|nr:hypothetical protein [Gemmataceae bacterium]